MGHRPIENYYEYHFERQSDGMVLELRWRLELTQPRFKRNLGMDWVWPGKRSALLAGAEVPDMDPETALLVLCMHGSKHVWSRLIWISDVARLIRSKSWIGLEPSQIGSQGPRSFARTSTWEYCSPIVSARPSSREPFCVVSNQIRPHGFLLNI